MLTLTRRIGEYVRIGAAMTVTLVSVEPPTLRLKITYPPLFTGQTFTFQEGQVITLVPGIAVTIHQVMNTRAKIGITAPINVKILRSELIDPQRNHPRA